MFSVIVFVAVVVVANEKLFKKKYWHWENKEKASPENGMKFHISGIIKNGIESIQRLLFQFGTTCHPSRFNPKMIGLTALLLK